MKRLITSLLIIAGLAIQVSAQSGVAPTTGDGSSSSPYQIETFDHLLWFFTTTGIAGDHFIQTADIDAAPSDTLNLSPKGFSGGSYDGQGHTIKNLYINSSAEYVGVFGQIYNASISNLGISNARIIGTNDETCGGGFAGYNNQGNINNCFFSGYVEGGGDESVFAGFVGGNSFGTVTNSYFSGSVVANETCQDGYVGGFCVVSNADGAAMTFKNCYSVGSITSKGSGTSGSGFLCRNTAGTVENCYSAMTSTEENISTFYYFSLYKYIGRGYFTNCFYDESIMTEGRNNFSEIIGLPTDSMKMAASFTNWDINETGSVWVISEDYTYPAFTLDSIANNAPFAFTDTVLVKNAISLDTLLANDYDVETGQNALTYSIISTPSDKIEITEDGNLLFGADAFYGDKETLLYRVEEVLSSEDTLWGGVSTATFINRNLAVFDSLWVSDVIDTAALAFVNFYFTEDPGITSHGICWSTDTFPSLADSTLNYGTLTTTDTVSFSINNLSPNKTYYVRAYAINASDTAYSDTISFTTLKRQINISDLNLTTTKVYDATDSATISNYTSNISPNDDIDLVITALYNNKNAGTGKTITISYSISGSDSVNYILPNDSVYSNGIITTKPLNIINAVAIDKEYDATNSATILSGYELDSVILGDSVALTLGTATFSDKNVDTAKTVTVSGSILSGTDADNYSLTEPDSLKADITAIQLRVSGTIVTTIKMNDGDATANIDNIGTLSGVLNGESVSLSAIATYNDATTAENKTITVDYSISGNDTSNYLAPIDSIITGCSIQEKIDISDEGIVLNSKIFCQNGVIGLIFTIISGTPVAYQIDFDPNAEAIGFTDLDYSDFTSNGTTDTIYFDVPNTAVAGTFSGNIQFKNALDLESDLYSFTFSINLSSDYLVEKYGDVILFDNSSNNYVSYQWYKDDIAIDGATEQFYYEDGGLSGEYYVLATTTDGETLSTCSQIFTSTQSRSISIKSYPNPTINNSTFKIEIEGVNDTNLQKATMIIYNTYGQVAKQINTVKKVNEIQLPTGIYYGILTTKEGLHLHYNIIVK